MNNNTFIGRTLIKQSMVISFETHPQYYRDFEECLKMLREVDTSLYNYPDNTTNFHIYTEVRTDKELVAIESFLATQNLNKCKLIVWSDYDISDNPRIQAYKNFLDLRVYDPVKEAVGTPLENYVNLLQAKDSKYYLQSDLLRILVLYKYGGVWFDMDMILLRDFLPILDQEYMYTWGSEINFEVEGACATVLSLKKQSKFASDLIDQLIKTPFTPNSTCWGKDMFASLYRKSPFPILPSGFFNTEWCINVKYPGLGNMIESGWFKNAGHGDRFLFLEAFGWHWHNSSNKNFPVEEGSKFDLLQKHIKSKLLERKII